MTNLNDFVLKHIILRFMTKDEWHTAIMGFFDGLSFENQGRWMRRALAKSSVDVAHIGTEKVWYYRIPYVLGELTKIFIALAVLDTGAVLYGCF